MVSRLPTSRLTKVDFPTLGRPTIAIFFIELLSTKNLKAVRMHLKLTASAIKTF